MRVRTPRPAGGCHQCCTSPSTNCRPPPAGFAPASPPGRRRPGPSRPAADRGSRRRRPTGRTPTGPRGGTEHLIQQPAIEQQVQRRVRRLHLHRRQAVRPSARRTSSERRRHRGPVRDSVAAGRGRASSRGRQPRKKTTSCSSPGRSSNGACTAAHGSSPAPRAGQADTPQRRRRGDGAVAAQELGAVAGQRPRPHVDVGEGHLAGEVGVERVARQQRAASASISVTTCMARLSRMRARAPTRRRTSPTAAAAGARVAQPQRIILTGSSAGTNTRQLLRRARDCAARSGVALAVPHQSRRHRSPSGSGVGVQTSPVSSSRR